MLGNSIGHFPLANDFHWKSLLSLRSTWAVVGQALTILFGLLMIRCLTEFVEPNEFGRTNLVLGAIALVNGLVCGPLMQATLRLLPEYSAKDASGTFLSYLKTLLVKTSVVVYVVFFVSVYLFSFFNFPESVSVAGLYMLDTTRAVRLTVLSANDDQKSYAVLGALDALFRPLGALFLSASFGGVMLSVLSGMFLGGCVALVAERMIFRQKPNIVELAKLDESNVLKELIRFCVPLIPLNFIGWITSSSDRYIAAELLGTSAAGLYLAIYGLTSKPCIACSGAIELVMRPHLYRAVAEKRFG